MFRSLLVPLDGSSFGEQALPLALSIARRAGVGLQLAHVANAPAPMYLQPRPNMENTYNPQLKEGAAAYLDGVARRLAGQARISVSTALLEGPVAEAIQKQVTAEGVDLVVMTTHGRGALSRAWLGSVADHLVRQLSVPLLFVRPREGTVSPATEPEFRRVLIPLDGSPFAGQILEPAVTLGRLMDAEYLLVRVIQPLTPVSYPLDALAGGAAAAVLAHLEALHQQVRQEAELYLEDVAGRLRSQGLRVQTRVVVGEQPGVAILQEAEVQHAGLIALGTHGRKGLERVFLGSVADKVVRGATIPILVQRPVYD
jgi:nucleotide-binding universal stress UspA family protein